MCIFHFTATTVPLTQLWLSGVISVSGKDIKYYGKLVIYNGNIMETNIFWVYQNHWLIFFVDVCHSFPGPFPATLWTLSERKLLFLISLSKKDPLQMHPPLPWLGISPQELHSQLTMKSHYCKTHSANMPREAFSTGNGFPFLWTKSW